MSNYYTMKFLMWNNRSFYLHTNIIHKSFWRRSNPVFLDDEFKSFRSNVSSLSDENYKSFWRILQQSFWRKLQVFLKNITTVFLKNKQVFQKNITTVFLKNITTVFLKKIKSLSGKNISLSEKSEKVFQQPVFLKIKNHVFLKKSHVFL